MDADGCIKIELRSYLLRFQMICMRFISFYFYTGNNTIRNQIISFRVLFYRQIYEIRQQRIPNICMFNIIIVSNI